MIFENHQILSTSEWLHIYIYTTSSISDATPPKKSSRVIEVLLQHIATPQPWIHGMPWKTRHTYTNDLMDIHISIKLSMYVYPYHSISKKNDVRYVGFSLEIEPRKLARHNWGKLFPGYEVAISSRVQLRNGSTFIEQPACISLVSFLSAGYTNQNPLGMTNMGENGHRNVVTSILKNGDCP